MFFVLKLNSIYNLVDQMSKNYINKRTYMWTLQQVLIKIIGAKCFVHTPHYAKFMLVDNLQLGYIPYLIFVYRTFKIKKYNSFLVSVHFSLHQQAVKIWCSLCFNRVWYDEREQRYFCLAASLCLAGKIPPLLIGLDF